MRWVLPLGLALLALLSACGGGDNAPTTTPTAPPSASPTASPSPSASPAATPNPNLITRGPDIGFPDDMAMIIESGCWGCDGGMNDLVRVYKDASGDVRTESLVSAVQSSLPRLTYDSPSGPYEYAAPVTGLAMTQDASVMAATFCVKGTCVFSGLGEFEADSESVVFRSLDGGITWQEIGRGGPIYGAGAVLAGGQVLIGHASEDAGESDYFLLPDNTPVQRPAGGLYPVTSSSELLWSTDDGRLLHADGSEFLRPPEAATSNYFQPVVGNGGGPGDTSVLGYWSLPMPLPRPTAYVDRYALAELDVAGGQTQISRQWEIDGYLAMIGSWSPKDRRAIISFYPEESDPPYSSPVPAIVDLNTGTYNLVAAPFTSEQPGYSSLGRTYVRAVQTGPFARVTGTGSCLNIRTDHSLTGTVLTCAADGVLLRDTGQTNGDWISVMTPGGTQGWASTAFLER